MAFKELTRKEYKEHLISIGLTESEVKDVTKRVFEKRIKK